MLRRISTVLSVFLIFSCGLAMAQSVPPGKEPPQAPPEKNEAPKTIPGQTDVNTTGAPVDPTTYSIGAEDILYIKVWREPDFTGPLPVRPDGKITMPLIGDLQAAGLTPERLGAQLRQALSDYITKPEVTVMVSQVNSKKYFISGEVNRPGQYALVVPTKVFDALNSAGGFRDFANKKDIVIIRGTERFKFNYNDVLKGKKLDQNIFLQSGDTVYIK